MTPETSFAIVVGIFAISASFTSGFFLGYSQGQKPGSKMRERHDRLAKKYPFFGADMLALKMSAEENRRPFAVMMIFCILVALFSGNLAIIYESKMAALKTKQEMNREQVKMFKGL